MQNSTPLPQTRFDYQEMVEILAESVVLTVHRSKPEACWETHTDDYVDTLDRSILAQPIAPELHGYVLAMSPNFHAFWSEYSPDEVDELIQEMEGKGNLLSMMAYYALQADVIKAVKLFIKSLDTLPVMG